MPYIHQVLSDFTTWPEKPEQKMLDITAILVVYFSPNAASAEMPGT
jgi:hypothetical protein